MQAEDLLIIGLAGAVVVLMATKGTQSPTQSGNTYWSFDPYGPVSLPAAMQCPSGMMYQPPPTVTMSAFNSQWCIPAPTTPQGTGPGQMAGCPSGQTAAIDIAPWSVCVPQYQSPIIVNTKAQ